MTSSDLNIQPNYFRQLDALRAIAVSMVIFSHWPGYHDDLWRDDLFWFNGEVGVKMFFIISGFLITGILLQERERSERFDSRKTSLVKTFYIRRFLRIFPLYYATLFVALMMGHPDVQGSWKWHVTYLSNFYFAIRGEYLGEVSHFWSLAVEEQFYFIWPLIMIFLPKKHLLNLIVLCICIAPVFRFVAMFILRENDTTVSVLPISSMDCLSAGALLAYIKGGHGAFADSVVVKHREVLLKRVGLFSAIAFFVLNWSVRLPDGYEWYGIFVSRLLLVPALVAVVILFINGFQGRTGKLLESPVMSYIGKISYGIYILHFFIPGVTLSLCRTIGWEPGPIVTLTMNLFLLFVVASLSWHLFEHPLNRLKRFFPYSRLKTSESYHNGVKVQRRAELQDVGSLP